MAQSPPAPEPPHLVPAGARRRVALLHRALVVGLFALFGLVLIAIVVVLVIVITHGGGIHMVE